MWHDLLCQPPVYISVLSRLFLFVKICFGLCHWLAKRQNAGLLQNVLDCLNDPMDHWKQLSSNITTTRVNVNRPLITSLVDLLLLCTSILCNKKPTTVPPPDIWPTERGRQGGAHTRLRKCLSKPGDRVFRDTCIITLVETWLDESASDSEVNLDNFFTIKADRTSQLGEERLGGLCLYQQLMVY